MNTEIFSKKYDNLVIGFTDEDQTVDINATDESIHDYYGEMLEQEIESYHADDLSEEEYFMAQQSAWDRTMNNLDNLIVYEK